MFSTPNITGFGTLGSATPSQNALGLPNIASNSSMPPGPGATSSPAFAFNHTPSGPGQIPLPAYGNVGPMTGGSGMSGLGGTPGALMVPPGLGMGSFKPTSTPGGQSVSGSGQQARTQASDAQSGVTIDAALRGLEEAMAAVQLLSIKADQASVFGGGTERGSAGAQNAQAGQSDVNARAAADMDGQDQVMAGDDAIGGTGYTGTTGGGLRAEDGAVSQRLQQTQMECESPRPEQVLLCG